MAGKERVHSVGYLSGSTIIQALRKKLPEQVQ